MLFFVGSLFLQVPPFLVLLHTISVNMLIILMTLIRQNAESHITMGTPANHTNANGNVNANTCNHYNVSQRHIYTSFEQELDQVENGQPTTTTATNDATTTTTTFAANTPTNNSTTTNNNNNKPTVLELYAAQKSKPNPKKTEQKQKYKHYSTCILKTLHFSADYNALDQGGNPDHPG